MGKGAGRFRPRRILPILGAALAALGAGLLGLLGRTRDLYHFAAVREGVLYRSGRMPPHALSRAIREHGIRTVLNLLPADDTDPPISLSEEREAVAAAGARFVHMPIPGSNPPSPAQVDEFLRILDDPRRRPVLVHCRKGATRTGAMVALYWVEYGGMGPEAAIEASDLFGNLEDHRKVTAFIRGYTPHKRAVPAAP